MRSSPRPVLSRREVNRGEAVGTRKFEPGLLPITASVAAALSLGACGGGGGASGDYAEAPTKICRDAQGRRADDQECSQYGGRVGSSWFFIGSGGRVPAVGQNATEGSFKPTAGVKYASAPSGGGGSYAGVRRGGVGIFGHSGRS